MKYAKAIANELRANMFRVGTDFSTDPIKARIANAEQARVHTMLVTGGRDMESVNVSVRLHAKAPARREDEARRGGGYSGCDLGTKVAR